MRTFCICCQELPDRMEAARVHFRARNVPADFVSGIHGETFGILSYRPYRLNYSRLGELTPIAHVGLSLSHYMVWQMCSVLPDFTFMVLEDDCRFPIDWQSRYEAAMVDLPADWDIFLIGNANCEDKPKERIKGDVWEVKYPFCTHAYLINRKALPTLLMEGRDASMKIDIMLMTKVYPKLRVYSLWPRLVDQRGTELAS